MTERCSCCHLKDVGSRTLLFKLAKIVRTCVSRQEEVMCTDLCQQKKSPNVVAIFFGCHTRALRFLDLMDLMDLIVLENDHLNIRKPFGVSFLLVRSAVSNGRVLKIESVLTQPSTVQSSHSIIVPLPHHDNRAETRV